MTDILNLPNWIISSTETTEDDYRIEARYNVWPRVCPRCGVQNPNISRFGTKPQRFPDLPVHAKRVLLLVTRQRYMCNECGQTFFEPLPDVDDKHLMTRRLLGHIERESLKRTFTGIAEDTGVDESTVRRIFKAHTKQLDKTIKAATPEWLGIDEIHLLNKPRCVLTNIQENTIVDLLENRNKTTLANYLNRIPDRAKIELVTMDMWAPYRTVVQVLLPGAQIVVDKFHVVRMANDALETIRKRLRDDLTDAQRRKLKGDRFILLRRKAELKPDQMMLMEVWTKNFPPLGQVYDLKEEFFDIWGLATDSKQAIKLYSEWQKKIPAEAEAAFKPLTTAFTNWHTEIFSYFDLEHKVTNAYTEGLNGIIKLTNRVGRGYSFDAIRAKILYNGGLRKHIKPNLRNRVKEEPRPGVVYFQQGSEFSEVDCGVSIPLLEEALRQSTF